MTATDYRRHCQEFTTTVTALCTDPGVRRDLRDGRGRDIKECLRLHRYLTVLTAGHGHRRAHYTLASLIALADPLADLRTQPTPQPVPAPAPRPDPAPVERPPGEEQGPAASPATSRETDPSDPAPLAADISTTEDAAYATGVWRKRPNLGATLARAVRQAGFNEDRTENLLHTIVRVDDDHLFPHILPSLAGRLLRAGVTPDWPVLLEDLSLRAFDSDRVGTRWLDAFYLALTQVSAPTRQGRAR